MKKLLFFLTCVLPIAVLGQVNFIENTTIRIKKVPVNSPSSDFGPSFIGDELWYSTLSFEKIEKQRQGRSDDLFYNLFALPVDESGNLKEGKRLMLSDISAGYHAGPVSFSSKTNELFVTLSNPENAEVKNVVFQKKSIPLKIVVLEKKGDSWNKKEELPFNNSSFSVGHPSISVTGDTLIFASDIPGKGMGGTDLYMSIRKNGSWGEMINLGKNINTPGNDMFPYLHKGKILFYASNGKSGGKGGFDIWYSVLTENGFNEPVNLSELNSPADDFGLVVFSNEETGYFVSNQNSTNGDDDIYQVFFDGAYNLELLVTDRNTRKPVANAKVEFNDKKILYTDNEGIIRRELGKAADYTASTSVEGFMNESVSFTTKAKPYGTLKEELNIEKVEVGQKFVMNNIYYQFDKWDVLSESAAELDKLLKVLNDNPSWKVELGSHTDCRGPDEYNTWLSQKRSASAVDYITGKGIQSSRIIARGYGETQLINNCKDGVNCTEEEHRVNRRTEFTILEIN